jgi:transposase InsO family protein
MPGQMLIKHEVLGAPLEIQDHSEEIDLDYFGLATHDVILGIPWLRKHNPRINWTQRQLSFEDCDCTSSLALTHRQRSMVNENAVNNIQTGSTRYTEKWQPPLQPPNRSTGHKAREEKRAHQKRVTPSALLDIPTEYDSWKHLFQEDVGASALPRHEPWDHEIVLQEGKQPTFGPLYGLSEKELKTLKDYLDKSLKKGYIRPSTSPAGYPILFVPKKDGSLRLCVDYRKLNDITVKNRYPLPNISELQDRLSDAKIFTALDLRDGYHLIRIKKGEEWKTAFRTRYGHYEYTVMPFGLTNAPATFQTLINNVLRAHLDKFVVAYLDDILVYSRNKEEHVHHVKEVLSCLEKFNLRLKPEKCEFHKEEVDFLGCVVSTTGVKMSPKKIQVVQEWPRPTTVKEIQEFLGFCNFNRRFIEGYSTKTLPLTKLTRKDTPFSWEDEQENAFLILKEACIKPPTLVNFRSNEPLRIETDASDLALGACASQERNGNWHPIAYYSRKFTGPEERYDVHDKELMAIVDAMKHWRIYAESCSELTVFTDHKNLTHFLTTKELNKRQVRWAELLGQYKFKIVYTPGKDNARADALSRRKDLAGTKEVVSGAILQQYKDGSLGPTQQLNNILKITNQVPEELQTEIIRQHHDDPVHGHPGIARTMELIQRNYEFSNMKDKVRDFISKCADCQKNKHSTHAPYGEMQQIQLPEEPWTDISMDFVTSLPPSRDPATNLVYDAILVIVDRLTKSAEMIPFRSDYEAEHLGYILLDRLVRHHGIPKTIISDRDKLFTSNYWTTLMAMIGTKRKLSTAYHPQTDGQTERTNRTMKTYLKIYCNTRQNNWVSLLPMAQLAYNNKKSESTGQTPFYANHGRNPHLFERTFPTRKTQKAVATANELKQTHEQLRSNIELAQQKTISYVNKRRKTAPQLKRGDKVYLHTKNLRTKRPSKGLDHVKVGPFLISDQKGPVNYELQLPQDARVHPVFHVSLLEPADPSTPLQTTFRYEDDEEDEFEVEALRDYREIGRTGLQDDNFYQEWLVKWKGYPESENTWEPEANLQNCQQLLRRYRKKHNVHSYTGKTQATTRQ